jgi:hypothetical protein
MDLALSIYSQTPSLGSHFPQRTDGIQKQRTMPISRRDARKVAMNVRKSEAGTTVSKMIIVPVTICGQNQMNPISSRNILITSGAG